MNKYSTLPTKRQLLSEYSPDDQPWTTHRGEAAKVESILSTFVEKNPEDRREERIRSLRDRVAQCAPWLVFAHTEPDALDRTFKLHETTFCRVRTCPVCQWRRSLRHTARFLEALPGILGDAPNTAWLFLTLTQKNCRIDELRSTLENMNRAWKRLSQAKRFKAAVIGYVKNIEVTRGADGSAHPHLHVMLLVSNSYFKNSTYITQSDWTSMWQSAARLDYTPIVDVRKIRGAVSEACREIMKYSTKTSDLVADTQWLVEYIFQVHKLRFLSAGGLIRQHLSTTEPSDAELVAPSDDAADDAKIFALSRFDWEKMKKEYFCVGVKKRPVQPPQPAAEPEPAPAPITYGEMRAAKKAADDARSAEILSKMRAEKIPLATEKRVVEERPRDLLLAWMAELCGEEYEEVPAIRTERAAGGRIDCVTRQRITRQRVAARRRRK